MSLVYEKEFASALGKVNKVIDQVVSSQRQAIAKLNTSPVLGGSKYPYTQEANLIFNEGDQGAQQLSLTTPGAHAVYATRIAIYPEFRFVTTDQAANGPDEVTFRPCLFSTGENVFNPRVETDSAAMDLRITLSEVYKDSSGRQVSRDLQNGPIPSQLLYSDSKNYRPNGTGSPFCSFDHGKGLFFINPWYLPPNSSVSVQVAPAFAGIRQDPAAFNADTTLKNQYRVRIVLDGFKTEKS